MQRTSDVLGVILVHGLWHGGWVWDAVRRDLDRAGVVSRVVELPMTDLASDITVTRRALDEFDRPAVLVGHSYGGAVTTGAGTHPHVAHLLYLAAYQLAEGESVGRTLPDLGVPRPGWGTPCASPTTARW
jgi:pimeloyl-ACP methyl ester carboxylesterase